MPRPTRAAFVRVEEPIPLEDALRARFPRGDRDPFPHVIMVGRTWGGARVLVEPKEGHFTTVEAKADDEDALYDALEDALYDALVLAIEATPGEVAKWRFVGGEA